MVAWDTETRSFRWWDNPAFLGSWTTNGEGDGSTVPLLESSGVKRLREILEAAPDKHLVGANSKFDAHMTREATGLDVFDEGFRIDDVLIRSRLLYGQRRVGRHGLKELSEDFIDPAAKDAEEAMSARYFELTGKKSMDHEDAYYITWQGFPEEVELYAGHDAIYTYKLEEFLRPQIEADTKLLNLYNMERDVQRVLYDAERRGVRVDPEAVRRLTEHYHERRENAIEGLQQHLGFVPEGEGSKERLREALIAAGVPLTERTEKTGDLAINKNALQKFSDHPAVAALFEWRRVSKFLSTYIEPLTDVEIVHATFNQAEAWTGRMSGSNPNMQNLPKRTEVGKDENLKVRSVFIPREGYEFIISDFDAIEMRILAWYLGDPEFRTKIDNGDPHAENAANAWGGVPEDYVKGSAGRWLRDIAKQATYGIVYGGGGPVVMNTINKMVVDAGHPEYMVDLEQARSIRRKLTDGIPGFKALTDTPYGTNQWPRGRLYQQLLNSAVLEDGTSLEEHQVFEAMGDGQTVYGYVRTLGGRKQWINLEKSYVALSGLIQGSAADIMKQAAVNLREALKGWDAIPLLFVHDEAVIEVPRGYGQRLVPIVEEAMTSAYSIEPILRVETHITEKSYAHTD